MLRFQFTSISRIHGYLANRRMMAVICRAAAAAAAAAAASKFDTFSFVARAAGQAFEELKRPVTSEPVLLQFTPKVPTAIFADSSDMQAGSFIAQDHG